MLKEAVLSKISSLISLPMLCTINSSYYGSDIQRKTEPVLEQLFLIFHQFYCAYTAESKLNLGHYCFLLYEHYNAVILVEDL